MAEFQMGNPKVNALTGGRCCGKPHGCSIPGEACLYFNHPWKRMTRGEITLEECTRLMKIGTDSQATVLEQGGSDA